MYKIVDEWRIKNYTVFVLDKDLLYLKTYNTFIIDGKKYKPVPVFDMPRTIATEEKTQGAFIGKYVEFALVE